MALHCANAHRLATALAAFPAVARVHYPGLPSHPGHALAARQMRDFGAMLSIELRGGFDAAANAVRKVEVFTNATSLGGCESLIEHRAAAEGEHSQSPPGLLRLSIGLEDADDLITDLQQALAAS